MSADRSGVVVVGSANLDLVAGVAAIPAPGETVLALDRTERAGGKGLNQAVASARAGVQTVLVAVVGDDAAGHFLVSEAEASGVRTEQVRRGRAGTGTAWILVRPDGENAIVVDAGANAELDALTDADKTSISASAVVVAQLEIPVAAVGEALAVARASGARTVLNAAPSQQLAPELLADVDVLVVNEHEARDLAGVADPDAAAAELLGSVGAVVVTLGADGALVCTRSDRSRIAGVPAEVVDTTGAGDTFTGVLAAALANGASLLEAARRAVVAGALAVETAGAVPSIPTAEMVDRRLAARGGGAG